MEPAEYCGWALEHLDDWAPVTADHAAIAVLLAHFARTRPSEPLFVESLRALARDGAGGSLSSAAGAIYRGWRAELGRARAEGEPLTLRPEDLRPAPPTPRPEPDAAPRAGEQPATRPLPGRGPERRQTG
jgi:hypothetical protein